MIDGSAYVNNFGGQRIMDLVLLIFLLLVIFTMALAGLSFAPWVPTWKKDIERAMDLVKLSPNMVFYDLGCGDGRVIFRFVKKYKCKGVGVEMAVPVYLVAKIRAFFYKNTKIILGNLFTTDLSGADVVFLFGMPDKLGEKLMKKFNKELKPGTQVISYVFPLKDIEPVRVDKQEKRSALYLYKF